MQEGLNVFLIDDDPDDQEIFALSIEKVFPQVKCEFAENGVRALRMLQSGTNTPNIIFIDMNMPLMGGVECLQQMRKLSHLDNVPKYMYSTSAEPFMVNKCLDGGAVGFIEKEARPSDLEKRIQEILLKHKFLTDNENQTE